MPRRTNPFQKLVRLLEEQLAPEGATVRECALVRDTLCGHERELDVLITMPVGQRLMTVGIECRDHGRKADVTWIEQLRSKFDALPIDRCVAVSRSGFTPGALARAKQWRIETISLGQALHTRWRDRLHALGGIELVGQHFVIDQFSIEFSVPNEYSWRFEEKPTTDSRNAKRSRNQGSDVPQLQPDLCLPDGSRIALITFLEGIVHQRSASLAVLDLDPSGDQHIVSASVVLPPGFNFIDNRGKEWPLEEVHMRLRRKLLKARVGLHKARYTDADVVIGSAEIDALPRTNLTAALTKRESGALQGRLLVHSGDFEMRFNLTEGEASTNRAPVTMTSHGCEVAIAVGDLLASLDRGSKRRGLTSG